jgi:hypothetical protein
LFPGLSLKVNVAVTIDDFSVMTAVNCAPFQYVLGGLSV